MAIAYVGLSAAATSTVTLPTFAAGDVAIVYAFRDGNVTPPSLPVGWTDISSEALNTASHRFGYRVLIAADTDTGTWTNATEVEVMVLRGQSAVTPIGDWTSDTTNNSNLIDYGGLTAMIRTDGTSLVAGFAAHRNATDVNAQTVSGMTIRSGSVGTMGAHTQANVTSFGTKGYQAVVNSSTGCWGSLTIEVVSSEWNNPRVGKMAYVSRGAR